MRQLDGKVAVITGAASGIGLATAARFAAAGMKVVMADVEKPALDRAVAGLRESHPDVVGVQTDVSSAESVQALAVETLATFGAVHVVFNNAGVTGGRGAVQDLPLETWRWTVEVNLLGVVHGIRTFLPHLLEQGCGHIVNTASMAALNAHPLAHAPYVASKFAVLGLTQNLFYELAAVSDGKIGVSVLVPSFVRTNIMTSARNAPASVGAAPPSRPYVFPPGTASPEEVAEVVHDGVLANRFYLFTDPAEAAEMADQQARWIRAGIPLQPADGMTRAGMQALGVTVATEP